MTYISGYMPNIYDGTILTGGTISNQFDIADHSHMGFYGNGFTAGTITLQARPTESDDWADVVASDGSPVSIGHGAGAFAVSAVVLQALSPYRLVRITTEAQANGARVRFITKA